MHAGDEHENYKIVELCIDGWNLKTIESILTGETDWEDTLMENMNEISHNNTENNSWSNHQQ